VINKIHHVGLAVHNADVMAKFLEEVFGAKPIPGYAWRLPNSYHA